MIGKLALAFIISAVMCYVATRVSLNGKLYDQPGGRKTHSKPVPHVGGIAIAVSLIVGVISFKFRWPIFFYGLAFLLLGAADDVRKLDYRVKLIFQILIASFYVLTYKPTANLFGVTLPVVVGRILSVIWIVALVNGFNFIDGLNGLAGSAGIIAAMFLWMQTHEVHFAYLSSALAGFLIFNFKRGKIFLGDGGSYFLGFLLAASSLEAEMGELVNATVFMGYPAYEMVFVVFRRVFRGISPFRADRLHTHYTLEDGGFSPQIVVLLLVTYSGFCNFLAFLQSGLSFTFYLIASLALLLFVVVNKSRL